MLWYRPMIFFIYQDLTYAILYSHSSSTNIRYVRTYVRSHAVPKSVGYVALQDHRRRRNTRRSGPLGPRGMAPRQGDTKTGPRIVFVYYYYGFPRLPYPHLHPHPHPHPTCRAMTDITNQATPTGRLGKWNSDLRRRGMMRWRVGAWHLGIYTYNTYHESHAGDRFLAGSRKLAITTPPESLGTFFSWVVLPHP